MEGTNCEEEAFRCFLKTGFAPRIAHINEIGNLGLQNFDVLYLPGGFSAGDYVRAGAIFASRIRGTFGKDLSSFVDEGKPVVGICNGFQVLTELGLVPDLSREGKREVALTTNLSNRFECRTTFVKNTGANKLIEDVAVSQTPIPVAHAEGRIRFLNGDLLQEALDNGRVLFVYTDPEGNESGYPWNPNGSEKNIAGITNMEGNVIGMMPHPERLYEESQLPRNLRGKEKPVGQQFFGALYRYARKLMY